MNTILDSTEYKTLHKLLVTATADEDGVVSNREEIDRAVDALLLLAETQQYNGELGIMTDDITALFDADGPVRFDDLRNSMLRYVRQLRLESAESTLETPARSTATGIPHSPIVEDISHRAEGLSLEPNKSTTKGLPTGGPTEAVSRNAEQGQPTAGGSGVEHRQDESPGMEKPGNKLGDEKAKGQAKDQKAGENEQNETNDVVMKAADKVKRVRDSSGESEQEDEDKVELRRKLRKKRRVSSKPFIVDDSEEEDAAPKQSKRKSRRGRKPQRSGANSDDDRPKFTTGRAGWSCVSCKKLGIECRIYLGRPLGRRRVACFKCNRVRKQCSFILHGKPHAVEGTKTRVKDEDSEGEEFDSEDEDSDELEDADEEEKGKGKAKQVDDPKGKGKAKEKAKAKTPSSRSNRAQSRARSASRLRVKFEDQEPDLEWVHTPNVGTSTGMIRRPRSEAHESAEIWAEIREMQGNSQDFRREIRGDMAEIRQDLGRITVDNDTATKFLTDKIVLVEKGLQSQIDCLQQQTLKISSTMATVVSEVSRLPHEMRNVMDTWGTIRFGPVRGTPTTVSGHDLQVTVSEWMANQAQILEAKPEPLSQAEVPVGKHEERTPSPTSSAYRDFVNLPSSQPKPEDDAPMAVDSDIRPNVSGAAADHDGMDIKMTAEDDVPQGPEITTTNNSEIVPTYPVVNVIGPTPTGSQQSITMSTEARLTNVITGGKGIPQSAGLNIERASESAISVPIPAATAQAPHELPTPTSMSTHLREYQDGQESIEMSSGNAINVAAEGRLIQGDTGPNTDLTSDPTLPVPTSTAQNTDTINVQGGLSSESTISTTAHAPSPAMSPIQTAPNVTSSWHSPIEAGSSSHLSGGADVAVHRNTTGSQAGEAPCPVANAPPNPDRADEIAVGGMRPDRSDIPGVSILPDNGLQVPQLDLQRRPSRQRSASPVPPLSVVTRSRSGSRSVHPNQDVPVGQSSRASNVRRGRKPASKRRT